MSKNKLQYDPWPELPYEKFKSTKHLLHMFGQVIGKLKLTTPFEPHFSNVALFLTSQGLTSGVIPYGVGGFSVDLDFHQHQVIVITSWGNTIRFSLNTQSVAYLTKKLFDSLHQMGIDISINPKPQEVPNPILFHEDTEERNYQAELANAWWRILLSSYRVMLQYHAYFKGITPSIGLMWGTFDLRDVRYLNQTLATDGQGFIRRNSGDAPQFEIGWWGGDDRYQRPAYFSFLYPEPKDFDKDNIKPEKAYWNNNLHEYILDYDVIRTSKNPEEDLFAFFESAYQLEAEKIGWDKALIGSGEPH